MKTKSIMPLFAIMLMGTSLLAASSAHAQDINSKNSNFFQGLVQMISQKFGLDQTKVQSAVTDYQNKQKATMQADMEKRQTAKLDKLVKDGKITDAQKQAIIKELAALKTKYNPDTMKSLTADQRKTQMEAMKTDITSWAKAQGIDASYLMFGFGRGGMRGGMINGPNPSVSPKP